MGGYSTEFQNECDYKLQLIAKEKLKKRKINMNVITKEEKKND